MTRPKTAPSSSADAIASCLGGQLPGVHRFLRAGQRELRGHRAHRDRVVAGDDLRLDVLVSEVAQRVRGIRAQPLLQDDQRRRRHVLRDSGVVQLTLAAGQQQHPQALGVEVVDLGRVRGRRRAAAHRARPAASVLLSPSGSLKDGAAVFAGGGEGQ